MTKAIEESSLVPTRSDADVFGGGREGESPVWLALHVAPLVALFVVIEGRLMAACRLPEASYYEPVIILQLARQAAAQPSALVGIGVLVGLAIVRGPFLWRGWSELEHGRALRVLVGGLAIVFAWTFATYDINFYFGRTHVVDRALLVVLAFLTCWRPVFLVFFLPLLLAVIWQFEYPLGGYSWTDKNVPVRVLLLFLGTLLWLSISGARRTGPFLFAAFCLVAAHYWIPGLEKLRLGWLGHGQLHHITLAAWANGWLAGVDAAQISSVVHGVARAEWVSLGFTIAAEAGALFFMLRRGVALALLFAWIILHAAIFAASGICFWKWALLDAGLIALLIAIGPAAATRMFGFAPLIVSLPLISGAPYWCPPVRLGWFDTRIADTYRYTVIGESGSARRIAPSFFAPYDLTMAQNRFGYLSRYPVLVSTYGMTQDRNLAKLLLAARTSADIENLEAQLGTKLFDEAKIARFDEFLSRALAVRRKERPWYTVVHPPAHIWTAARDPAYRREDVARHLLVDRVTTLWDGERLHELRVERVRELAIGGGRSPGKT